uniref:Uncharacterized protein n=1 Tax=Pectobacterium carotovorum TaxID=554 RepID=A0A0K0MPX9_PECCA|nr:hypothetical protein [Pectobacterium carotovorum]AKG47502.1 hypothetical protein pA_00062 [Pectobacterium carotovorum]
MEREKFIEKLSKIDGFLSVRSQQVELVVETGISVYKTELARLLDEKFLYAPNTPCLRIDYIRINSDDCVFELIYACDLVKEHHVSQSKTPITYMVGFADRMLVAAASDNNILEPITMFDNFLHAYQKQSDDEFIGMPISDLAYAINHGVVEKAGIFGTKGSITIDMLDYSKYENSSSEISTMIKDMQGGILLTAPNIRADTILHANAFMDNIINRSAKTTAQSIAEIGMMKEQALSYGLNASSSKIMELQIMDSPLSGMAGMF